MHTCQFGAVRIDDVKVQKKSSKKKKNNNY